jgi:hypothetical protein
MYLRFIDDIDNSMDYGLQRQKVGWLPTNNLETMWNEVILDKSEELKQPQSE